MDSNWFKKLFINEVKSALSSRGAAVTDDQVATAVSNYLDENPVQSATAKVENGVLKVT